MNAPLLPKISEVDLAEVSTFLDSILLLLKAMGINFFISSVPAGIKPAAAEIFPMQYKDAEARMAISDGKYVQLKGSTVVAKKAPAAKDPLRSKRKFYLDNGLISAIDEKGWFVNENLEFDSASYVESIVAELGVNGLIYW